MSLVVALTGSAGVGKSTVAEYLVGRYGFQRIRFSDPLKKPCCAQLRQNGTPALLLCRRRAKPHALR